MRSTSTIAPPFVVCLLLFEGVTQLDLTGPSEVFARMQSTRVHLIAANLEPMRTEQGMRIIPDTSFADAPRLDLRCVPRGWDVDACLEDDALLSFIRTSAGGTAYVTFVCSGALILDAAGHLKGYDASTHWMSLDLLSCVGAEPAQERVVRDRNRVTGGGETACAGVRRWRTPCARTDRRRKRASQ